MRRIVLPWPYAGLSPNDRAHWRVKAKAKKAYRFAANMIAREAGWHKMPLLPMRVTFCPPSAWRTGDMDNLIARMKSAQDGIADAMGINDRDMRMAYEMGDRCKDGGVIVEILTSGVVS